MSRNRRKAKTDKVKRQNEVKKAKQKRLVLIGICALAVIAVLGFAVYSLVQRSAGATEIYRYGEQTVRLREDGSFSASLAHNVRKRGTYSKETGEGRTIVTFTVNGNIEIGWIVNDSLHIPMEWDDGHGHGNILPKRN